MEMFARRCVGVQMEQRSGENISTCKGGTAFIFHDVGIPVLRVNLPNRLKAAGTGAARPAAG